MQCACTSTFRMLRQTESAYWWRDGEGTHIYTCRYWQESSYPQIIENVYTTSPIWGSIVADIPVPDDMIPRTSQSPQTGYSALLPFLQKQGRTIDRVLGDSNCLFRALSLQLSGSPRLSHGSKKDNCSVWVKNQSFSGHTCYNQLNKVCWSSQRHWQDLYLGHQLRNHCYSHIVGNWHLRCYR